MEDDGWRVDGDVKGVRCVAGEEEHECSGRVVSR